MDREHPSNTIYLISLDREVAPDAAYKNDDVRYTFYGAARLAALLTRMQGAAHHVHMKTPDGWLNVGRIEP